MRTLVTLIATLFATPLAAETFVFDSIDGGTYDTADWAGRPMLVVNTASLCGFTPQYAGLQEVYDRYKDDGLVVLAIPSDDFRQELSSESEVKDFCELNFDLDFPMTTINHVRGSDMHPFYRHVEAQTGFVPAWNFNKVLVGPDGKILGTWGSVEKPGSPAITDAIEAALSN